MRLPASLTALPPDGSDLAHSAASHADPTGLSDAGQTVAERKPWWARVSNAVAGGVFTSAAGALIAVTGAIYVGMYHAPWVKSLASHTPTAAQAGDAMGIAMAAGPANAAPAASAPAEAVAQPAPPDHVAAARDRMEQRVYSQVQRPRARTVAETETLGDSEAPAPSNARRRHRSPRYVPHGAPYNAAWYKGA